MTANDRIQKVEQVGSLQRGQAASRPLVPELSYAEGELIKLSCHIELTQQRGWIHGEPILGLDGPLFYILLHLLSVSILVISLNSIF